MLAACGGDTGATRRRGGTGAPGQHALIAAFPQGGPHIPAGAPTRLPYLISDAEGVPLARIDSDVRFTVTRDGRKLATLDVAPRGDGVPRAYLPVGFTFPTPGIYDLTADYDGSKLDSTVQVVEPSRVGPPFVGSQLRPVDSPTTDDPLGVDPLCSRTPACPYHGTSLRSAVAAGRPTVLLVATPAYCQTSVCGPVLDLLMEQTSGRDDLTVLHSEVYRDPKTSPDLGSAALAPVPEAYRLDFEPVLFITDRNATVVARADVTVDRGELKELLALAV